MKITHIKFKVSAGTSWNCHKCKKKVRGQDGFIEQLIDDDYGWSSLNHTIVRICWNCFQEFLEQCSLDRKLRKENYRELEKKAIIRNLEK